jgi:hypothetical protein
LRRHITEHEGVSCTIQNKTFFKQFIKNIAEGLAGQPLGLSTLAFLIDTGFRREKSSWTDEEKDAVCEFLRKMYLGETVIRDKMPLLLHYPSFVK